MLHQSWLSILFFSFAFAAVSNAFIACFSAFNYKNTPAGKLSHSQLRVKQGNANFEQRFNVFILSLLFSVTSLRILLITIVLATISNFIL
ncbi:MAG: hypothetical protein COA36_16360 [Desulfotalea sp.]|nr:MAG: hypothetical protein COA36_16360 [Desulfotalea sp.]